MAACVEGSDDDADYYNDDDDIEDGPELLDADENGPIEKQTYEEQYGRLCEDDLTSLSTGFRSSSGLVFGYWSRVPFG